MLVGIVCEGFGDYEALGKIVKRAFPGAETQLICPEVGQTGRSYGWRGVEDWCKQYGAGLDEFMRVITSQPYHLLVIHVDASMAHNVAAMRPCPPASATTDQLREVILRNWLARENRPGYLVFATPSKSTDGWFVEAISPNHFSDIECVDADTLENRLIALRYYRRKKKGVSKPREKCRELASKLISNFSAVAADGRCSQALRFVNELNGAVPLP